MIIIRIVWFVSGSSVTAWSLRNKCLKEILARIVIISHLIICIIPGIVCLLNATVRNLSILPGAKAAYTASQCTIGSIHAEHWTVFVRGLKNNAIV